MEEDNLLIKKYLDGDQASLKLLIDKYTPSIYNFISRFIEPLYREDIFQETFIKVWKNLKNFNENKSQFKTWLFIITRNTITDFLRKKKSIIFSTLDTEEETFEDNIKDDALLPNEIYQKLEDKKMIENILEELESKYKEVIILHYQEGMTFREISEVLNKPMNTIKSYHFRAIKKLKDVCTKN